MKKITEKMGKKTTTNYPPDSHAKFCERCFRRYNNGICPANGKAYPSKKCSL